MNRRLMTALTAVLGLLVVALAVCSATVWRPSSTAQATLPGTTELHYVVTQPGVLGLVDSDVTITATAVNPDEKASIVIGHSADVQAWLAQDPYLSVTGLSDWTALTSTEVTQRCETPETSATPAPEATEGATAGQTAAPSATPSPSATPGADATASGTATAQPPAVDENGCTTLRNSGADPTGSDLWVTSASDTGQTTLSLDATDSDLVALVSTDGSSAAPKVALSWPRNVSTPWLIPGLVVGALLILLGVFGFLVDVQTRHAEARRGARAAERAARIAAADGVSTAALPRVDDPNRALTRRELREKARAEAAGEEWMDPRTRKVYVGGQEVPTIPQADEAVASDAAADTAAYGDYEPQEGYGAQPPAQDAGQETATFHPVDDAVTYSGYEPQEGYGAQEGYGPQPPAQDAGQETATFPPVDDAVTYGGYEPQKGYGAQPPAQDAGQETATFHPVDDAVTYGGYEPQEGYGAQPPAQDAGQETATFHPVADSPSGNGEASTRPWDTQPRGRRHDEENA